MASGGERGRLATPERRAGHTADEQLQQLAVLTVLTVQDIRSWTTPRGYLGTRLRQAQDSNQMGKQRSQPKARLHTRAHA